MPFVGADMILPYGTSPLQFSPPERQFSPRFTQPGAFMLSCALR